MAKFDLLKKVYGYIAICYDREEAAAREEFYKEVSLMEKESSAVKKHVPTGPNKDDDLDMSGFPKDLEKRFSGEDIFVPAGHGIPSQEPSFAKQEKENSWTDEFIYLETLIRNIQLEAKENYNTEIPMPEASFCSLTGAQYKAITGSLTAGEKENPWSLKEIEIFLTNYPLLLKKESLICCSNLDAIKDCFDLYDAYEFYKEKDYLWYTLKDEIKDMANAITDRYPDGASLDYAEETLSNSYYYKVVQDTADDFDPVAVLFKDGFLPISAMVGLDNNENPILYSKEQIVKKWEEALKHETISVTIEDSWEGETDIDVPIKDFASPEGLFDSYMNALSDVLCNEEKKIVPVTGQDSKFEQIQNEPQIELTE